MSVPLSKIQLTVSCSGLENTDLLSKSDPQLFIFIKRNQQWLLLAKSEVVWDNLNPKFGQVFHLDYYFEEVQILRFLVVDVDDGEGKGKWEDQDFLGQVELTFAKIVTAPNQTVELDLMSLDNLRKTKGKIKICAEEDLTNNVEFEVHLEAHSLDRKNFPIFGKSDPYLVISRARENGEFQTVYQTEIINDSLTPAWKPFTIRGASLNNGDMERVLLIQVFSWARNGHHALIGEFKTSTTELVSLEGDCHLLINPEEKKKHHNYKHSGFLNVISFKMINRASFLEYIKAGLDMNLIVAIDFTQSNGDPNNPNSLHYLHTNSNPYQSAIYSVGSILQEYDSDQMFPVYGFGAKFFDGNISHCFALNGNPQNPEVNGISGILQIYSHSIRQVQLWGPTNFAPVLRTVQTIIQNSINTGKIRYFILLIVTDGVITDMDATIRAIIDLSALPLSIVIVGVGNADFTNMNILDADDNPLRMDGKKMKRDIVQFVPMSQMIDPAQLTRETLAEIPTQIAEYMEANKLTPQDVAQINTVRH